MGPTDRGIWNCVRKFGRRSETSEKNTGCGFWNVYVGRSLTVEINPPIPRENGKGWDEGVTIDKAFRLSFRQVDTKCRHCDRRHRFRIVRRDVRGGVRRVTFRIMPSNMAVGALIEEVNQLNRSVQLERDEIRFVRARDYRRGKND